jgi:hypothetical protein
MKLFLLPLLAATALFAADSTDAWIPLFDGKSLDGWKASDEPGTFSVQDGELVVHGTRSHLYYVGPVEGADFKNFEIKAEVMTKPGANSGIYIHTKFQDSDWPKTGYEIQVNNTHKDPKKTAGLYGVKDNYEAPAKDDEWFTITIRVEGKHIVTKVNGNVITDWTEPEDWQPPAQMPGRKLGSGTIAIQGHDPGSEVHYRNIAIKLLP